MGASRAAPRQHRGTGLLRALNDAVEVATFLQRQVLRWRRRPQLPRRPLVARGRRILAVEDDPSVRKVLRLVLELEDYEVETASDLVSARALLQERDFDLLVLDVNLPDGTGFDLLRFLRDDLSRTTPVLMLSGLKQEENIVRALDLGADDYVQKPFGPRELQARVRRRIGA